MKQTTLFNEHHIFDFDGTITTESGQDLFNKVYDECGGVEEEHMEHYFHEVQSHQLSTVLAVGVLDFLCDLSVRKDCKITILSNNYASFIQLTLKHLGFGLKAENITIIGRAVTQGVGPDAYGQYGGNNKGQYIKNNINDAQRYYFYDDSASAVKGVLECTPEMNMMTYHAKPSEFNWPKIQQDFSKRMASRAPSDVSQASLFASGKSSDEEKAAAPSDDSNYQLLDEQSSGSKCPWSSTKCTIL